jgi:hypothetical protein
MAGARPVILRTWGACRAGLWRVRGPSAQPGCTCPCMRSGCSVVRVRAGPAGSAGRVGRRASGRLRPVADCLRDPCPSAARPAQAALDGWSRCARVRTRSGCEPGLPPDRGGCWSSGGGGFTSSEIAFVCRDLDFPVTACRARGGAVGGRVGWGRRAGGRAGSAREHGATTTRSSSPRPPAKSCYWGFDVLDQVAPALTCTNIRDHAPDNTLAEPRAEDDRRGRGQWGHDSHRFERRISLQVAAKDGAQYG